MCLMRLGAEVCGTVTVVHCNHGIRPEADGDEAFVKASAEQAGLPFVSYAADVPTLSAERGVSLETAGRDFRRSVMDKLIAEGYVVCTAHHADDNAETVLMHLLRGSGIRGLGGMRAIEGRLARPLIDCTRAEIEAYARENAIEYVTDATNADITYTRNFIRHRVLPVLGERFDAVAALNRLARNAREADAFIVSRLDPAAVREEKNVVKVAVSALQDVRAEAYVRQAMTHFAAADEVSASTVDTVRSLTDKQSGKRVRLSGGVTARREYDDIVFLHETQRSPAPQPFQVGAFASFGVTFTACPPTIERGALRFDPDKLPSDAIVRTRKVGDRFRPYGSVDKSLKAYLIDKKVPARVRDVLPLVAAGDTVYAVCGVEIGEAVKLDASSRRAVQIEVNTEKHG